MKLEVDGVFLEIDGKTILSDVYLAVELGETVGILGRNGSGKSTLFDLIFSLRKANSFSLRIDGIPRKQVYKNQVVQYLPQGGFLPNHLTISATFKYMCMPYVQVEGLLDCTPNLKVGHLSLGQKRILELHLLLNSPSQFVFLDEPFSGLSPLSIELIKAEIVSKKRTKGIVITDHLFREILDVSDRLLLMESGALKPIAKSAEALEFAGYLKAHELAVNFKLEERS